MPLEVGQRKGNGAGRDKKREGSSLTYREEIGGSRIRRQSRCREEVTEREGELDRKDEVRISLLSEIAEFSGVDRRLCGTRWTGEAGEAVTAMMKTNVCGMRWRKDVSR